METTNSSETKELQVGTEINLNILTGLGNILAASSKDMDIDSEKENAHIDRNKVRRLFLIRISWTKHIGKISKKISSAIGPLK